MICDQHPGLEDESEWALIGHYSNSDGIEDRRYALEDAGVASLTVETDDEAVELYVPLDEKDDAFDALTSGGTDQSVCEECKVEYSSDIDSCPVCGAPNEQKSYDDN